MPDYEAVTHLKWGDGHLEPGDDVPEEHGRDYGQMLRLGQIKVRESAQPQGAQRTVETPQETEAANDEDELLDGVTDVGGGWFELPDGRKVRGQRALAKALGQEQ